jgi:cation diffusion facilitator family transporter
VYIALMMIGLFAIITKNNLVKKVIGLNILQTAVILFFISIGAKRGATIPIIEHGHGHDHNLRAAHLHVIADALTSILAIVALLAAKHFGAVWMDPAMGIVGGFLVARWSWGLMKETSRVLLDRQAPEADVKRLTAALQDAGDVDVVDLHLWWIGPGYRAAIVSVETTSTVSVDQLAQHVPDDLHIEHLTIEIRGAV